MRELTIIFEMIGTAAFAISGAVVGLKSHTDLFGVISLGIVTAIGGGMIRDVILGITPPSAMVNPVYFVTAALTGLTVFLIAWASSKKKGRLINNAAYKRILLIADSIGLGIFTVIGTETAWNLAGKHNAFLCIFCGMLTATGGGLLRDMMVDQLPDIFKKYIYAVASLIGASFSTFLFSIHQDAMAIWAAAALVVCIRLLAAHYHWNLPKIADYSERSADQ